MREKANPKASRNRKHMNEVNYTIIIAYLHKKGNLCDFWIQFSVRLYLDLIKGQKELKEMLTLLS